MRKKKKEGISRFSHIWWGKKRRPTTHAAVATFAEVVAPRPITPLSPPRWPFTLHGAMRSRERNCWHKKGRTSETNALGVKPRQARHVRLRCRTLKAPRPAICTCLGRPHIWWYTAERPLYTAGWSAAGGPFTKCETHGVRKHGQCLVTMYGEQDLRTLCLPLFGQQRKHIQSSLAVQTAQEEHEECA